MKPGFVVVRGESITIAPAEQPNGSAQTTLETKLKRLSHQHLSANLFITGNILG